MKPVLIILLISHAFSLCFANEKALDLNISLTQRQDLQWRVRYEFTTPQSAFFFWRSLGDYRTESWEPISDNVHIGRLNGLDAVWFDKPSTTAEFSLTPYTDIILAEYTPFIKFSDGGFGVFTGQFDVASASSKHQIALLNGDTQYWEAPPLRKQLEIRSNQTLVSNGKTNQSVVKDKLNGSGKYIYVGSGEVISNDHFIGIIDVSMPIWLRAQLNENTPIIFNTLSTLYRHTFSQKIELLYAFKGTDHSGFSYKGGVLGKNSLVLESSGALFLNENPRTVHQLQKTLAHEAAHLFQNAQAQPTSQSDPWIHEGGADAATVYTLHQAALLSSNEVSVEVKKAYTLCSDYLKQDSLNRSIQNGDQAHYHCGQIIAYSTAAALGHHSYFDFWAELVSNPSVKENGYDANSYYQTMLELGADQQVVSLIQALVSEPVSNPNEALSALMLHSGVSAKFNEQGVLIEFQLP